MIKRVSIDPWDSSVVQFLKDIQGLSDSYVLELEGQPVAEVIPKTANKKEEYLNLLEPIWKQTDPMTEEEVERLVDEAVKAVRSQHADSHCT